jgi:hypothetical protein
MRIPDQIRDCVCFLCTEENGRYQCKGTGFFVSVRAEHLEGYWHLYLVTARHNVVNAINEGGLYMRLNTVEGGVDYIRVETDWIYPESDASDVAVTEFNIPIDRFQFSSLTIEMLATEGEVRTHHIGIGDEIYIAGLFTQRHGTRRNLPIVRTGIIASMPDEPIQDEQSGLEYDAYLAEVRSIGGLSGSPVFIFVQVAGTLMPMRGAPLVWTHKIFVLGLIRGHWDIRRTPSIYGLALDDMAAVNMGMATVTPIQEVIDILRGDELVRARIREEETRVRSAGQITRRNP